MSRPGHRLRTRALLAAAMAAALAGASTIAAGCAPKNSGTGGGELPSPREAARLPLSDFAPSPSGPGLGAELVFERDGAALLAGTGGDALTLPPGARAVVRWIGLTPGLVADLAFAAPPAGAVPAGTADGVTLAIDPSSATRWDFAAAGETSAAIDPNAWSADGVLLLAARNDASVGVTLRLALDFAPGTAFPSWEPAASFPVQTLPEPSGIDHDPKRRTLWVVSDTGDLARVDPDTGEVIAAAALGGDLEAVRWVPGLDLLLVADEASDTLHVVAPETLETLATATLVFGSAVTPVPESGGNGIEGLAVTGVTGRTVHLLLANQNDPHALFRAELALPDPITGALAATVLSAHPLPAVNLSEVVFDWGSRRVFRLNGYTAPAAALVESDGSLTFELANFSSEGAAIAGAHLFTAHDLGGLARYEP